MNFETALNEWLQRVKSKFERENLTYSINPNGKKYIRIEMTHYGQTSVFCFIDKETGQVLKADGWAKPAKQPRGNIYEEGKEGVSEYGALYLR